MEDIVKILENQSKPISEVVFSFLRKGILSHQYSPGERLIETEISKELGVSRTPIREAFRKLELEGLVKYIPKKGIVVNPISSKDMEEIFEIRMALEGLMARLAADRMTEEEMEEIDDLFHRMDRAFQEGDHKRLDELHSKFHLLFAKSSKNKRLCQMIESIRDYIKMSRAQAFLNPNRVISLIQEHRDIVDAISRKDGEEAEKLARRHVQQSKKHFFIENDSS